MVLAQETDPIDPLVDACGLKPSGVCKWVFEQTGGNVALTKTADWLISRPLAIGVVLLGGWVLRLLTRRWSARVVRRIITPPGVVSRLGTLGADSAALDATEQRRASRAASLGTAVSSTIAGIIWLVAILMIANILSIPLAPFLAGAGILTVALGFGSQSLVKDCINGFHILTEDQYGIGDSVDLGEAIGVVEEITLRATVLRGFDGTVWHVPNGQIVRVGNRTQLWSAAVLDVEVAYDADLAVAKSVLQETADAMCALPPYADAIIEAPTVLGVESLTATGITLRLMVKTAPGTQWVLQRALREAITASLRESGVALAAARYPRSAIDPAIDPAIVDPNE